jgi:hypothetical protein
MSAWDAVSMYGAGALLTLAALAIGIFPGFLLGVPQTNRLTDEAADRAGTPAYRPNAKLELIADWLIKIAVGVGLVELRGLLPMLTNLGRWFGPAFGPEPVGSLVVIALATANVFIGFFVGFIVSFTDGPSLLNQALDELSSAVESVNEASFAPRVTGTPPQLPPETQDLAAKLRPIPLEDLTTDDAKLAWARVRASDGDYPAASRALRQVRAVRPQLAKKKADTEALIGEGEVFSALYEPKPEGFTKAIELGEKLIEKGLTTRNLDGYMACAYGQKHAFETARNDAGAAKLARNEVLKFAEVAARQPTWRRILLDSLNQPPGEGDDDLSSLANDKELRAVLEAEKSQGG